MGEAKVKKQKRLAELRDANCVLCGGTIKASTVEHIPPKVFFINKQRPKSHEVPACERCNRASAGSDQIAALCCLTMRGAHRDDVPDAYFRKLLSGVKNNHPDAVSYIGAGPAEPVFQSRFLVTQPRNVKVKVDRRLWDDYLNQWAAKQVLALYYLVSQKIFPADGAVFVQWISNYQVAIDKYPKEILENLTESGTLEMGTFEVSDQFFYRYHRIQEYSAVVFMMGMQDSAFVFAAAFPSPNDIPQGHALNSLPTFSTSREGGVHKRQ